MAAIEPGEGSLSIPRDQRRDAAHADGSPGDENLLEGKIHDGESVDVQPRGEGDRLGARDAEIDARTGRVLDSKALPRNVAE